MKRDRIQSWKNRAFSMIEIIIVIGILAVLGALLLMKLGTARVRTKRVGCTNMLKQTALGFRLWACDSEDKFPMQICVSSNGALEFAETGNVAAVFLVLSNELQFPKVLWCPTDTRNLFTLSFSNGLANSNVNYFVGVNADVSLPFTFLAGDSDMLVTNKSYSSQAISIPTNGVTSWSTNRHNGWGNVALADGSVQSYHSTKLPKAINNCGTNQVHLAFP